MTRPTHEIDAYLDGDITAEQARTLEAWIQADPKNAHAFLSAVRLHQQIGERVRQDRLRSIVGSTQAGQADNAKTDVFDAEVLGALLALEQAAEVIDPVKAATTDPSSPKQTGRQQDDLTPREIAGSLAYLGRRALLSKPAFLAYATAVVLLVGVLVVMLSTDNTGDTGPAVAEDPGNDTPGAPVMAVVATLTAEHDAVWYRRPGEDLYAGQRFTLTEGFAEVTTARGAIALIQAPATIEFLDNPNALFLHSGRFVGTCDTPSSKGFVVRTPHMDVVDLGTEFGVTVRQKRVETVVFDGEVEVYPIKPPGASANAVPVRLSRGQYAAAGPTSTLTSGDIADGSVGLSYLRSLKPNDVASWLYAQSVLEHRPLIYWRMQGLAVQPVVNGGVAGNRYDGRTEAPEHKEGGIGGSYAHFGDAGPDSMITINEPIRELEGSDSYTIECWVRVSDYHRGMIAGLSVDGELSIMHLEVIDDVLASDLGGVARTVRLVHRDTPSILGGQQLYSEQYRLDTWMHLVCVKNGDRLALFIDGELADRGTSDRPIAGAPRLLVGLMNPEWDTQQDDARIFHGGLDEFALYRQPLDAQVIRRHYALGTNALLDHDPVPLSD